LSAKGAVRLGQRTFDDDGPKAARIDEQVGFEPPPVLRQQGRDIAAAVELDRSDPGIDMFDSAPGRDFAQIGADEMRVEMIAVAGREGEVGRSQRRSALVSERGRQEEAVRVSPDIAGGAASPRVVEECGAVKPSSAVGNGWK
jgi:hypothetical protein